MTPRSRTTPTSSSRACPCRRRTRPALEDPGPLIDQAALARFVYIPDYSAVRSDRYLYVEYADGERELYDVVADPDEANNLAGRKKAGVQRRLAEVLAELRTCHRQACREADCTTHAVSFSATAYRRLGSARPVTNGP